MWAWLLVVQARAEPPAASTHASAAVASDPSAERARGLFQKGVELAKQRQFGSAEQRFRDALALRPAPAVEYNLAAALFELHKYDEAFNRSQSVQRDPSTNDSLRERAAALERALYPHVARLTVITSSVASDLTVSVDGAALPAELLGVPRAVSPGSHQVAARRAGTTLTERTVDVPLRTAAIVDLSLVVTEQTAQAQPALALSPASSQTDDDRQSQRRKRLWLWGGIAAGVLVVGVAVGVGVALANSEPTQQPPAAGDFQPGVLTWR